VVKSGDLLEAEGHGQHADPHDAVDHVHDQTPVGGRHVGGGLREGGLRSKCDDGGGISDVALCGNTITSSPRFRTVILI